MISNGIRETRELKMWLAVRADLSLSPGKMAVQAAHAAGHLHLIVQHGHPDLLAAYLRDATPKIAVRVESEAALKRVALEASKAGIPCYTVADAGRSEIDSGTETVCMFGPAYRDELPSFLRRLQILGADSKSGSQLADATNKEPSP